MSYYVKLSVVKNYRIRKKLPTECDTLRLQLENEVTSAMLFVYECTGNIIADFKKFYDTQLSEQDKKKIFIPTYDCMKRYQGSWHVEQKPLFTDCFFIECRDKEELKTTLSRQHCSDSLAEAVMSGITPLRPEQEEFLKALMQPDTKTISMSTGYIKDGTTHVTQGPLQGREKFIRRIDRHKRLAWLVLPAGDGQQELRTGLEIISKG